MNTIKIIWRLLTKGTKEFKEAWCALMLVKEEGIDVLEASKKIKGTPSKATVEELVVQLKELTSAVNNFADEGSDVLDLFLK